MEYRVKCFCKVYKVCLFVANQSCSLFICILTCNGVIKAKGRMVESRVIGNRLRLASLEGLTVHVVQGAWCTPLRYSKGNFFDVLNEQD